MGEGDVWQGLTFVPPTKVEYSGVPDEWLFPTSSGMNVQVKVRKNDKDQWVAAAPCEQNGHFGIKILEGDVWQGETFETPSRRLAPIESEQPSALQSVLA